MGGSEKPGDEPEAGVVVGATNLTKIYQRGDGGLLNLWRSTESPTITAVDDVDISVSGGECVGIKGPSGSGKTTLLHLLAGLDTPTSGRVHLAGARITSDTSERQRSRHRLNAVGVVFQRFHLLPALSARANVALPLVQLGKSKRARRKRAERLLSRVGLEERASHNPGQLSGGEQQRVAIARALATDPALLVADEPTGELDSATAATVLDLISELSDDHAVIIASHDEQALAVTDRTVSLRDGAIVSDE